MKIDSVVFFNWKYLGLIFFKVGLLKNVASTNLNQILPDKDKGMQRSSPSINVVTNRTYVNFVKYEMWFFGAELVE